MPGISGRVRLREVRERLFVTQKELAQRSGVTESSISRIESGVYKPRISTIRKLAAALGVEPRELVVEEEETGAGNESPQRRSNTLPPQ